MKQFLPSQNIHIKTYFKNVRICLQAINWSGVRTKKKNKQKKNYIYIKMINAEIPVVSALDIKVSVMLDYSRTA